VFKQIDVRVGPDGTVVDFWPGMFVKPTYEKEVSKQNPDIKADLGVIGGKLSPLKAYYPKGFELKKIENAADVFSNKDNLFAKIEHCPMCERKRREIVERLRQALGRGTTKEEKMKAMTVESDRIRKELGMPEKKMPVPVIKDAVDDEGNPVGDVYRGIGGRMVDAEGNEVRSAHPRKKEVPALVPVIIPGPIPGAADDIPVFVPAPLPPPISEPKQLSQPIEPTLEQQQLLDNINVAMDSIAQTANLLFAIPEKIQVPSWR
jgi:hypothetical protein